MYTYNFHKCTICADTVGITINCLVEDNKNEIKRFNILMCLNCFSKLCNIERYKILCHSSFFKDNKLIYITDYENFIFRHTINSQQGQFDLISPNYNDSYKIDTYTYKTLSRYNIIEINNRYINEIKNDLNLKSISIGS